MLLILISSIDLLRTVCISPVLLLLIECSDMVAVFLRCLIMLEFVEFALMFWIKLEELPTL